MKRIRFTIASLLVIIFILGVGFAALRESSDIWESGIFSLTLAALLLSILFAIHRTERRRAFWLGFALFGSAYLGLSLVPSIEPRLITTKALAYLDSKMPRSIPRSVALYHILVGNNSQVNSASPNTGIDRFEEVTSAAGSNTAWFLNSLVGSSATSEHFISIGHSILAVVVALLGGQLSSYLRTKSTQETSAPVPAPVSISNDLGV